MADPVPSLPEQEARGQLEEEVQKLVDGVMEDVRQGKLKTRPHVRTHAQEATDESKYTRDYDLALEALGFVRRDHDYIRSRVRVLAFRMLHEMVVNELAGRPEYRELPE